MGEVGGQLGEEDAGLQPGTKFYPKPPPTSWNSSLTKGSKHGSRDFRPRACQLPNYKWEFAGVMQEQSQIQDTTPPSFDSPLAKEREPGS